MYGTMDWILDHWLAGWVKKRQPTSRWNFSSILFAFALFFVALVPEFLSLYEGNGVTGWAIVSWVSTGLGILFFLVFLWFLLWCRKNPSEDTTEKMQESIDKLASKIDILVDEIRRDREHRNGKQ